MSHTHRPKSNPEPVVHPVSPAAPTFPAALPEPTALGLLIERIMMDDDLEEAQRNSYKLLRDTPNVKRAISATCKTFGILPESFKEKDRTRALSGMLQLVNIGFLAGTAVGFLAGLEFETDDDGDDDGSDYTGV